MGDLGGTAISTELQGSYVRAALGDGSPVPRIPPLSLAGTLVAKAERLEGRIGLDWQAAQRRVAAYETPTDGFVTVDTSLTWRPLQGKNNVTVIAAADNLFDAKGRRHASFTKDFVPIAGLNFKLSLRVSL